MPSPTFESSMPTLRPATYDDLGFLTNVFLQALRAAVEAARGGWDEARERDQFEKQLSLETTHVIRVGEQEVGFLTVVPRSNEVELHTLCVLPRFQGCGIGGAVTQQILHSALATETPVALSVLKANPRARALYERLGFCAVAESEHHIRLVHNRRGGRSEA